MTATVTDLFCGAGGSSLGATGAGLELVMAANHWQTAIDVHQVHFPDAAHDVADVSQVDPRRYPRTDVLLASPECTNHSQARGVSRRAQDPTLWDAPDPAAERSRATMWDVCRFAEQMRYDAIVVENVVEATKWVGWRSWSMMMHDLGYDRRVLSLNSQDHRVAQSRDRLFVVFWRRGMTAPDLEMERVALCPRCEAATTVRQSWKNGRTVGRYRSQWVWGCIVCGTACDPERTPAASIIDWTLDCPRIGDRVRPLAAKTRARILAGLQRYGWAPIVTTGAGNGFERTPGNRARSLAEPLPTQTTTVQRGMATPPLGQCTECAQDVPLGGDHSPDRRGVEGPWHSRHCSCWEPPHSPGFLVQTAGDDDPSRIRSVEDPYPTVCASDDRRSLVVPLRANGVAYDPEDYPLGTVTAGGFHHGLLMRNNTARGDQGQMVTPISEPARTMTTAGHQSLLMPYYGQSVPHPTDRPIGTVTTRDRHAVIDPDTIVDDCGFRMLEPYEVAAAMAFPEHYIPRDLSKKDQVKLAGNAVTPPVMQWITGRVLQALEAS